jgi:protein TonB
MTAKQLLARKAGRYRFLVACAVSLFLHGVFLVLVSVHSADPPGGTPTLQISFTGGGAAEASGGAPREMGSSTVAPGIPKHEASPESDTPAEARPATQAEEPAKAGEVGSGAPVGAKSEGTAGPPDAAQGSQPVRAVSGAASGSVGGSGRGPGSAGESPDAVFAARVGAAIEARKTYPEAARRRGASGVVRLKLRVSGDGRLIAEKLAASSGSTLLDRAALDLVSSVFPLDNLARRELELVLAVSYSLED